MSVRIAHLLGVTVLAINAAAQLPFPEFAPEIPVFDTGFLDQAIPAEAIMLRPGTDEPVVRWDRDHDGFLETWADFDEQDNRFDTWTVMDPVTELSKWRVRVSKRREAPYEFSWDINNDGVMDWTLLDYERDGRPEEVLWQISGEGKRSARFLDRNADGIFEVRCWIDLTGFGQGRRRWAVDENADGSYEREIEGSLLTENGYDPAWAERILEADTGREELRWDVLNWHERQGNEGAWRHHALLYALDPQGDRVYEMTYRPIMRRSFHSDPTFREALLTGLRTRSEDPQAGYGTLWAMGELLRWQAAPPEVHPAYLPEWRRTLGLPATAELPVEVDGLLAAESDGWFKRSLASERTTRAARESVVFHLARLYAVEERWDLVRSLCTPLIQASARVHGPISPRHLELADLCFAYGNFDWARELYAAMAAHWQMNPTDPDRAMPNHTALIRLGIIALNQGNARSAQYYLTRALDSLSPDVPHPDTVLARMLLGNEETQPVAREYLEQWERRIFQSEQVNITAAEATREVQG